MDPSCDSGDNRRVRCHHPHSEGVAEMKALHWIDDKMRAVNWLPNLVLWTTALLLLWEAIEAIAA